MLGRESPRVERLRHDQPPYAPGVLSRYRIVRGRRPPGEPAPTGIVQDTRKHTRHPLRPAADTVEALLADPSAAAFRRFRASYLRLLRARFRADRAPFDRLAALATDHDVHLGCNCPTRRQPDVRQCHTWLALEFLRDAYPELVVVFPDG